MVAKQCADTVACNAHLFPGGRKGSFFHQVNWNKQVMTPSLTYAWELVQAATKNFEQFISFHPDHPLLMTSIAHLDTLEASRLVIVRSRQMPETMLTLRLNHSDCVRRVPCAVCAPKGYGNAIPDG